MIPRTVPSWQRELGRSVRDPAELIERLRLEPGLLEGARSATADFPLYVPPSFLERIVPGDPDDPLLRQVLPLAAECETREGFTHDPVGDLQQQPLPGLLRKYRGRALLITTGACAIHCRYCFRRHFPYPGNAAVGDNWRAAVEALAADPTISELILSGGDPLLLGNEQLALLLQALEPIPHLRRLRIHSRLPIVHPQRIDEGLLTPLQSQRLDCVVVVHANHPNEIDAEVDAALRRLARHTTLFNQSVLLKGINDSAATLCELSERLFASGVIPYYLHQLDRVAGAAHFEVSDDEALALERQLRARLPGYLVPRLVREIPGAPGKTPLAEVCGLVGGMEENG